MPALTGLHPCNGRLRCSDPLGNLGLRQTLRGSSLEELVQQRELVGQLLELRADRILTKGLRTQLLMRQQLSTPSCAFAQLQAPWAASSRSSSRTDAA